MTLLNFSPPGDGWRGPITVGSLRNCDCPPMNIWPTEISLDNPDIPSLHAFLSSITGYACGCDDCMKFWAKEDPEFYEDLVRMKQVPYGKIGKTHGGT